MDGGIRGELTSDREKSTEKWGQKGKGVTQEGKEPEKEKEKKEGAANNNSSSLLW
jgi:hypothetical protein